MRIRVWSLLRSRRPGSAVPATSSNAALDFDTEYLLLTGQSDLAHKMTIVKNEFDRFFDSRVNAITGRDR